MVVPTLSPTSAVQMSASKRGRRNKTKGTKGDKSRASSVSSKAIIDSLLNSRMVHDDDSEDSETTLNKQSPQKMKRLGTIADRTDTLVSGDGHFGMTSNSDMGA